MVHQPLLKPEAVGQVAGGGAGRGRGSGKRWRLSGSRGRGAAALSEGESGPGSPQSRRCSVRCHPHVGRAGCAGQERGLGRGSDRVVESLRPAQGAAARAVWRCGCLWEHNCRPVQGAQRVPADQGTNWAAGVRGAPVGEASWAPARGWPGAPSGRRGVLYTLCAGRFVSPRSMEGVVSVSDTCKYQKCAGGDGKC